MLPVVGNAAGTNGTFFKSTVTLLDTYTGTAGAPAIQRVRVDFYPHGGSAGLTATGFTAPAVAGKLIEANDIEPLRSGLAAALGTLTLPAPTFTDDILAGMVIKSVHFEELRIAARQ